MKILNKIQNNQQAEDVPDAEWDDLDRLIRDQGLQDAACLAHADCVAPAAQSRSYSILDFNPNASPVTICDSFSLGFFGSEVCVRMERRVDPTHEILELMGRVLSDFDISTKQLKEVFSSLKKKRASWRPVAHIEPDRFRGAQVLISKDRQRAWLVVSPDMHAGHIAMNQVLAELDKHGLRERADMPRIMYMLENGLFRQAVLIARGAPPEHGRDAALHFHFNPGRSLLPRLMANGDADFKNIENIPMAEPGAVLVSRTPATPGAAGVDVTGREIPAHPGHDTCIPRGRNTSLSPDGNKLVADIKGHVIFDNGALGVDAILYIPGDVDYTVGNIDYTGVVVVNGSVRGGFSIRAQGDIRVNGTVEGADLESTGGHVVVRLGVQGRGRAHLRAAGDVRAKFINQAHVQAGRDVVVQEAVMHAQVRAGRRVLARGPKGCLIGGAIHAGQAVVARVFGSASHPDTRIVLESLDPETGEPEREVLKQRYTRAAALRHRARRHWMTPAMRKRHQIYKDEAGTHVPFHTPEAAALNGDVSAQHQALADLYASAGPGGNRLIRALTCIHPKVTVCVEGKGHTFTVNQEACAIRLDQECRISVSGTVI